MNNVLVFRDEEYVASFDLDDRCADGNCGGCGCRSVRQADFMGHEVLPDYDPVREVAR